MKSSFKRSALQHPNPVEHEVKVARIKEPAEGVAIQASEEVSTVNIVPTIASASAAIAPSSPSSNRERFRQGFLPARTCCNLDLVRASAGSKFNLTAVCIAVFPASQNPDRRYIQLADDTGSVGVTLWNHNVQKFSNESVGRLVTLCKAVIGNHNGKKHLSMARDSSIEFTADIRHPVAEWWQSCLKHPAKSCGSVHDIADNLLVTVSGVVGAVSSEVKIVNGQEKILVSLHLVDASGRLDIRTWNHSVDVFQSLVERPVLIRRVRVTSFASQKLCELLDGTGSIIETTFPGQDVLVKFWSS